MDDYIAAADAARSGAGPPLPEGFASREQAHYGKYSNGIFWSKALELLLFHRATWPAVLELTGGRPRFTGGTLLVDDYDRGADLFAPGAHLHGVRDRQLNKEGARSPACCCEPRSDGILGGSVSGAPPLTDLSAPSAPRGAGHRRRARGDEVEPRIACQGRCQASVLR